MTSPHPAKTSAIIPSLDGIRAISIAIVFFAHAGLSDRIPGGFGVTVFFFLSGFLITTLLTREYDAHDRIAFGAFYMRRLLRLGPPLLVTLAAAAAVAAAGLAPGDLDIRTFLAQIFFYYNYFSLYGGAGDSVDGLGVLWSLSVEEHFYMLWPVLFLAIARRWIGATHVAAMLMAILAWRCVRFFHFGADEWTIYISSDTRMDGLLFGCLLALMDWRRVSARVFPGGGRGTAICCVALLVLLASFLIRDPGFRSTIRYTLQGAALAPLFYYAIAYPRFWVFRWLNWAPIRRIGLYSYTIYLAHYVIIRVLEGAGMENGDRIIFIPAAAVLSIGYAALVFELAERPLRPLRKRLTGH